MKVLATKWHQILFTNGKFELDVDFGQTVLKHLSPGDKDGEVHITPPKFLFRVAAPHSPSAVKPAKTETGRREEIKNGGQPSFLKTV